ncbi:MAG: non-canonical purine NTP pyrophosphatase [Solirubrobacteraceae bacterium]
MKLLLATHNEHKRREFERLLAGHEVEALPDEVELPPEDGETFAENALGKARAAARATGRVTIADDSGIEARALGGAPGVRSARYAGERATDEENLAKLLREAPAGSGLAYVCALVYIDPRTGVERVVEARCTGRLAAEPRGAGGFGYDPAFVPEQIPPDDGGRPGEEEGQPEDRPAGEGGDERTMAELSDAQKDAISHRGRAVRALVEWLASEPAERPLRAG